MDTLGGTKSMAPAVAMAVHSGSGHVPTTECMLAISGGRRPH